MPNNDAFVDDIMARLDRLESRREAEAAEAAAELAAAPVTEPHSPSALSQPSMVVNHQQRQPSADPYRHQQKSTADTNHHQQQSHTVDPYHQQQQPTVDSYRQQQQQPTADPSSEASVSISSGDNSQSPRNRCKSESVSPPPLLPSPPRGCREPSRFSRAGLEVAKQEHFEILQRSSPAIPRKLRG